MRLPRLTAVLACLVIASAVPVAAVEGSGDGNTHRFNERRWPWTFGTSHLITTLGPNCPHCPAGSDPSSPGQSSSAWLAVDVDMYFESVRAVDAGRVVLREYQGKAGYVVRTHAAVGPDGEAGTPDDVDVYTTYEHLKKGSFLVAVDDLIAPGRILATSGDSGAGTGAHLHIQRHDANSFASNAVPIPPINGWTAVQEDAFYSSANAGVGCSIGDSYRHDFATTWRQRGGYAGVGVTGIASMGWYPCRFALGVATAFVYSCTEGGWGGYVQMFLGPTDSQRVIMRRLGTSTAYVVGRGILGALTDLEVMENLGYPTSERLPYSDSGDPFIKWRQEFQGGYVLQTEELAPEDDWLGLSCRTEVYAGSYRHTAYYCEERVYLDGYGAVALFRGDK